MAESAFEMTPSRKGYCARRTLVQWWRSFSCVATLKIGHLTKGEDMRGQCWQLKCKCVYITFCTPRFTCHELDFSRLLFLFEIQLLKKNLPPCLIFLFLWIFLGFYNNCWSDSKIQFHIWEGRCLHWTQCGVCLSQQGLVCHFDVEDLSL